MSIVHRIAATAGVVFALCTSGVATAAQPDDPCVTVPESVVSAVLDAPIVKRTARPAPPAASCSFRAQRLFLHASITAYRWDSVSESKHEFQTIVTQTAKLEDTTAVSVSGIGDEAQDLSGLLYTRKGSAIYVFSIVNGKSASDNLEKRKTLAKNALVSVKG